MNERVWYDVIPVLLTAVVGGVSTLWVYLTERKKRRVDYSSYVGDAVGRLNDTINLQSKQIQEMYERMLSYRESWAKAEEELQDKAIIEQNLIEQVANLTNMVSELKEQNRELKEQNVQLLRNQKVLQAEIEALKPKSKSDR